MKTTSAFLLSLFAVTATLFCGASHAVSGEMKILHKFPSGAGDGWYPLAALISDNAGNLYGTTEAGGFGNPSCGIYGCGIIFELSPPTKQNGEWIEHILYRFRGEDDGGAPEGALLLDSEGNLYGTTAAGGVFGFGTVFQLTPPASGGMWTERVLHAFQGFDGQSPLAGLIFDQKGDLYGTTALGGNGGAGVVFELDAPETPGTSWSYSEIYDFNGTGIDGDGPQSNLIFDVHGNLYGTTITGGSGTGTPGVVFELMPPTSSIGSWTETVIYAFQDVGQPQSGLIFDQEGNLYGTASAPSTVFELSPSGDGQWTESTLYQLNAHARYPMGDLLIDSSGNLYGTASDDAIFEIQPGGNESQLNFYPGGGPLSPHAGLIFGFEGALYGTTEEGGGAKCSSRWGCGTVIALLP